MNATSRALASLKDIYMYMYMLLYMYMYESAPAFKASL